MVKAEYAYAMATLLCLDRGMEEQLMLLSEEVLAKMYTNYIQNAKDANHKLEQTIDAYEQKLATNWGSNRSKAKQ